MRLETFPLRSKIRLTLKTEAYGGRLKNRFQTASIIAEVMYKRICWQINGKGIGIAGIRCKVSLLLFVNMAHG